MLRAFSALLLALPCGAQFLRPTGPDQGPATGKAAIEGTVVDSVTHEPVKKAQVMLAGPVRNNPIAVTDTSGRFSFRDLPAGGYWVNASKSGYNLPQNELGMMPNPPIALNDGDEKKGVEIALNPGGSIRGRIVDEEGAPLRGCSVTAARTGYEQGRRTLQGAGAANTDGKGEYAISGLLSGRYALFARCMSEVPAPHPLLPRGDPRTPYETYLPKFHGGSLDPSSAARLAVPAGANLDNVDFEMHRTALCNLRGSISSPDPEGAGNVVVMLTPVNRQLRNLLQTGVAVDPRNHTFTVRVFPGSYILAAWSTQGEHTLYAQRALEIGSTPPDPIEIVLSSGSEMKGTVEFDSPDRPPLDNIQIFLHPVETDFYTPQPHGNVHKDGTFTLEGVVPGRWRVMLGAPGYLKSVYFGGQEVSPYGFSIGPGAAGPLRVVIGSKRGEINVTVNGAAASHKASVVLYPEDVSRLGSGLERVSEGVEHMSLGGVPPGRYRLLATDALNPWPILQRPDVLKALESSTRAVEVPEDGKVSATVEIVPREQLAHLLQDRE